MLSDWFNGIEIFQGRWQHEEKVGYCYSSKLENTLCKWDIHALLVTKGLKHFRLQPRVTRYICWGRLTIISKQPAPSIFVLE
jgi:hypothetical protein